MNTNGTPLRITPDTRTPCCARVPKWVDERRYACRGCGTVYVDSAAIVAATFGPVRDVTRWTPERLRRGGTARDA